MPKVNRTGNFIAGGNPQVPSLRTNNGVFDQKDVYTATNNGTWQEADGIYEIPKSLRFRSNSSTRMTKSGLSGSWTQMTYSFWIKGNLSNDTRLFQISAGQSGAYGILLQVNSNNQLNLTYDSWTGSSGISASFTTTASYRDPSAWYHIVVTADITQPFTQTTKIYVNGIQQATTSSLGAGAMPGSWSYSYMWIGSSVVSGNYYGSVFDGYLSELNFIDGQSLDPSYFGYFDPNTNIWQPKPYTGKYGTNGFYLPFKENESVYNLGRNFAGSNLLTYSSTFDNAVWSMTAGSVASGATTAPDGTSTAYYLKGNATNTFHYVNRAFTCTASTKYTWSVYCKKADYNSIQIGEQGSSGAYLYVSLLDGSIIAQGNCVGTVSFVGNGWYRISCTFTTGGAQTTLYPIVILLDNSNNSSFAGSTSQGTYIWGGQLNLGNTADALILTTSAAVSNDWTLNNFYTLGGGASCDSMVDSPTNVFTTATDVGATVSGNYCTFSAVDKANNNVLLDANLVTYYYPYANTNNSAPVRSTMGVTSGKWYFEFFAGINAGSGNSAYIGLTTSSGVNLHSTTMWQQTVNMLGVDASVYNNNLVLQTNGWSSSVTGGTALWNTYAAGDIVGFAIDLDAGKFWVSKNGSWYNSGNPAAGTTPTATFTAPAGTVFAQFEPITSSNNTNRSAITVNFGQRPFNSTPPAGFKTINTTNLQSQGTTQVGKAGLQPNKWFDVSVYEGTGQPQNIVNSGGFQPDLVWTKQRNSTGAHCLVDTARGVRNALFTDRTDAETGAGNPGAYVTAFNSNGFGVELGTGSGGDGSSYVGYQWKQSPTSGFAVVPYTGTGSNMTISHNLGVAPKMIIVKDRTVTSNWVVQHDSLGWGSGFLGIDRIVSTTSTAFSNNTAPTSSNFTVSTYSFGDNTLTRKYIAYLWAEVPGFSKFGSWTNNSSTDGTFVYTGFRPAFVMVKNSNDAENWYVFDSKRRLYNVVAGTDTWYISPNLASTAEGYDRTPYGGNTATIDFLSNGFRIKTTNASAGEISYLTRNYIFAAFAETPFALNNRAR